MSIFNGATARALQATLDDITLEWNTTAANAAPFCPTVEQHLKQQYAAMLKKMRVCTCGGKFAGGTHSSWCDIHE